jgi:hypothetical protein
MANVGSGALRLTFAYEGRSIELRDVEPVDTVAPAPPPSENGVAGFAVELLADDGELLFRRMLQDPLGESVELPTGDRDKARPFERATVEKPSGTFIVMVPAVEGRAQVALFERVGEEPERMERIEPIARFDLPGRPDSQSSG